MISRQLKPIHLNFGISMEEAAQALMFSYSAYTNDDIQPRFLNSYQRAWGFDDLINFPRDSDGTPGFIVAIWSSGEHRRMVIGVEGTTSLSQLANLRTFTGWTSRVGVLGYVMANFKTKADAVWTKLVANNLCAVPFADARTIVTWTGHSLGAAIADINAIRQKTATPTKHVRLIKFGSPRVGNSSYVNRFANALPRASFYCRRDPCFLLPTSELRLLGVVNAIIDSGPVSDGICDRMDPFSGRRQQGYYDHGLTYTRLHVLRDSAGSANEANNWYDHMTGSYRLAFVRWAMQTRDLAFYRLNYLEHNWENIWQVRAVSGVQDWPNWSVINDALNIQQDPPTAGIDADVQAQDDSGGGGGEWDDDTGGGGGDWGDATIPGAGVNANTTPLMQEMPAAVADFGMPVPGVQAAQFNPRRRNR